MQNVPNSTAEPQVIGLFPDSVTLHTKGLSDLKKYIYKYYGRRLNFIISSILYEKITEKKFSGHFSNQAILTLTLTN
mgnify:CR=1 FL=1